MMAACVLADSGYRAMNFGPETPPELLATAAEDHKARMVWLSVKVVADRAKLRRGIDELAEGLNGKGITLVVGGDGIQSLALRSAKNVHVMQSMTELAAFARGASNVRGEEHAANPGNKAL